VAEFAAIPLFTDAWIADTSHLTRPERGLYMDLLILIWRSPECRVPNDMAWIARRLRVDETELPVLKSVVAEFLISTGNWLTQKRLKREWSYTFEKRKKNIESAKSRWHKGKEVSEGSAKNGSVGNATAMPPHPHPHPHPHKEREANASPKKGSRLSPDWQMPSDWIAWAVAEGMAEPAAQREAARFKDYWLGKPGKDGVKLDWNATWRNWARKALDDVRPKASANRDVTADPRKGDERTLPDGRRQVYIGDGVGWATNHG
jgi:uncharacterized protein YdaU (DUF1376 family)